ncbi:valine--tRNA ligase [Pedomonas mirosovicensis]|uniref:valine--tRNA ligase n=1 Tax=Pedomonas mirosovicensis TaxID=2908641 RepID=UPI002167BB65|nr:valine--tRNA ligase [Pedomonas mirosovicensis]MCH8685185.1 valine--tRNA ligase [Pedomonas mirosovicensis]
MLEKTYEPSAIEAKWYQIWEESGAFKAGQRPGAPTFTIVIPPPNVTGSLHMGHALNNTLQDVLVRYHRLKGYDVLWQPGTDHAGIATQMVVERQLDGEGLKRADLGREKFLERVWSWKAESGGTITRQLRRLGASCDWSRERFTMDEGLSRAVVKVFVDLYNKGLLYRDKRLVNWDPRFKSAISDLEVEMREVQGIFAHLKYPLADDPSRYIVVATTRPETMLGDTAVAVHPEDERYKDIVGQMIRHPLTGRLIPIIADEWADPELGSGAVKITPAHDFNDFAVGQRHKLPMINIFDAEARVIAAEGIPSRFVGLDRFEARKEVLGALEALGFVEKIEPKTIQMPYGDRSGVVIEPWLTDQWYVDAKTLAQPAIEAVRSGRTKFVPEGWTKTYYNWMENIEPWCVSRQLWWGHQIPAWYAPDGSVFVAETEEDAYKLAHAKLGLDVTLRRDEDVLDTWFSSALWPFGTLGWPEQTETLKRHYPTDVLVTGFDIIFFWVARMMMQGIEFMGTEPFHTVYCHGLVRDEKGQKMSKSKGNVVDPLTLMDKFGADALRFFMCAMESQGRDIKLSEARIQGYRNFGTKLWNASRFCQMNGIGGSEGPTPPVASLTINRWIIGEVAATVAKVEQAYAAYRFDDIANTIYSFVWDRFCDWYLELIKPILNGESEGEAAETRAVAGWVLDQILVMLHPIMPFLTEELWNALGQTRDTALITAEWPKVPADVIDASAVSDISWLIGLISSIRSARTELNVPPSAKIAAVVTGAKAETIVRLKHYEPALLRLARLESINPGEGVDAGAIQVVVEEATYLLPVADIIDLDAEKARLTKSLEKTRKEMGGIEGRLNNPAFIEKAKPEVVEEAREKLADLAAQAERLENALKTLG